MAYEMHGKTNLGLLIDADFFKIGVKIVRQSGQFKTDWFATTQSTGAETFTGTVEIVEPTVD